MITVRGPNSACAPSSVFSRVPGASAESFTATTEKTCPCSLTTATLPRMASPSFELSNGGRLTCRSDDSDRDTRLVPEDDRPARGMVFRVRSLQLPELPKRRAVVVEAARARSDERPHLFLRRCALCPIREREEEPF